MPKQRVYRKICPFCHNRFRPNYRHGNRQKACNRPQCQRLRHNRATAEWKKKTPDYHRHHYQDYVKPWRQRQKLLSATRVTSGDSKILPAGVSDDHWLLLVTLIHQLGAQITACIDQGVDRLEQRLRQAA